MTAERSARASTRQVSVDFLVDGPRTVWTERHLPRVGQLVLGACIDLPPAARSGGSTLFPAPPPTLELLV